LIDFNPAYLSQVPFIFSPFKPIIHFIRDTLISFQELTGLPFWAVIITASIVSRILIFPLLAVQIKETSKLGQVFPVLVHIKETWKHSPLPFRRKVRLLIKIYRKLAFQAGFSLIAVICYYLAYWPIALTIIYGIRLILGNESIDTGGFLYI
jgi:membrane protein insertase Oxa1/YidC/SpoIIIJ